MDMNLTLMMQLFVLLNPLSSFPFLITAYHHRLNVKRIAFVAVVTAFVIAIVIALFGDFLFKIFGVSLDAFRIAGGIILLLLGINTVRAKGTKKGEEGVNTVDSMTAIIATPMLTGPATISFITIKTYEFGKVPMLANIVFAFVIVGVIFMLFSLLVSKINPTVVNIASRIVGLFLTAVAIELIAKGVIGLVHTIPV